MWVALAVKLKQLSGDIPREAKLFALKGIILLLVWNLLYNFVLQPYNLVDPFLTRLTGTGTLWICRQVFSGHALQLVGGASQQFGTGELIELDHHPMITIFNGCNGLELFVLFTGFICCIPFNFKRTSLFVLSGVLFIYVLNILRCTALVSLKYHNFKAFDIAHHYIFQYTVYLAIFLIWERYFKTLKLSHESAAEA